MKSDHVLAMVMGLFCGLLADARAQGTLTGDGTFVNLDFESADVPPVQNGQYGMPVPVSQALPGWTAYLGTSQINNVVPNLSSLSGASISILTPQWGLGPAFQGSYMVLLQAAEYPSNLTPTTAAIAQTGEVPLAAQRIVFDANTSGLQVTFNGNAIPLTVYAKAANYSVYEGSVSAWAGQTGELRFTVPQANGYGSAFLDNIQFFGVPEPGPASLMAMGGLFLLGTRARLQKRRKMRR